MYILNKKVVFALKLKIEEFIFRLLREIDTWLLNTKSYFLLNTKTIFRPDTPTRINTAI